MSETSDGRTYQRRTYIRSLNGPVLTNVAAEMADLVERRKVAGVRHPRTVTEVVKAGVLEAVREGQRDLSRMGRWATPWVGSTAGSIGTHYGRSSQEKTEEERPREAELMRLACRPR